MTSVQSISVLLPLLLPALAQACWSDAAQRYGVPVALLHAVARVESNLDPRAINRAHEAQTGTYDIGLMQINSSHLKSLRRYGIDEASLLEPCTNLHIGAWLLAQNMARHGVTWNAIGAYNAACTRLNGEACLRARADYAWKVYRRLHETSTPVGLTAKQTRDISWPVRRGAERAPIAAFTAISPLASIRDVGAQP